MCEFCESLKDKSKEIIWSIRSHMAEDNICEFVNNENCENCNGCCHEGFKIEAYDYEDNTKVGISYFKRLQSEEGQDITIHPFSESIQWNFCPVCGKQISKEILDFEKYYSHQICIDDKE